MERKRNEWKEKEMNGKKRNEWKEKAVSRLKCNVFEVVVPVCHEVEVGQEDFCWAFPSE
jgi:hypothetical protein